jgi:UPF0176 protein
MSVPSSRATDPGLWPGSAPPILNVAGYRFVPLEDLPALRKRLFEACAASGVRGTILLAPEGINFFVAGTVAGIDAFRNELDADRRLAGIELRQSWSPAIPFRRLKVRLKREIIALGVEGIDPAHDPAPALQAETLKDWLDAGRDVVLVDTRNAFEVERGTFSGAVHLGNTSFRGFARAATSLPPAGDGVPVVTFCTGGIRCEKAAPLLRRLGHRNVYQLAGGILRYFRDAGSAHYRGTCFVFDERVALDAQLDPPAAQNPLQV